MRRGGLLLAVSLVVVALNLRPAVVGLAPALPELRAELGLSVSVAGMLTTVALICFGAFAPVAPRLAHRVGLGRTVGIALLVILVGLTLRLVPGVVTLYVGTFVAAAGIGIGNVAVPSVVKRDFADRAGLMTGFYTMAITGGACLASGLTVPIGTQLGGWRFGISAWAVVAVIALLLWLPRIVATPHDVGGVRHGRLTGQGLAWFVTLYMGGQSLLFYSVVAWLPDSLVEGGMPQTLAGAVLALLNGVSVLGALLAPQIAARWPSQRAIALGAALVMGLGIAGLAARGPVWLTAFSAMLTGMSCGAMLGLSLLFVVLRARTPEQTAGLGAMSQSLGYLLAATGPVLVGLLRDATGSWPISFTALALVAVPLGIVGWLAGSGKLRDTSGDRAGN